MGARGALPSPIYDAARGMLVYESMRGLANALELIEASRKHDVVEVLRVKDRFTEPMKGWSDVLLNMRFTAQSGQSSSLSFEVQVVHRKMLVLRHDLGGHDSYDQFRVAQEVLSLYQPG